ncbi:hypothetical protein CHLRE_07g322884v5 [Chlamydomonas reinhardtii]|uniref:Glycosyltransferase n=1 Tax=Chlamydomonas reinhardtii TaxID=3055 RepID=A0A2K3DJ51_CHLRE|nr:uncharacterized protein CHLRE_07g322884v5 [Chlamydomonas reinhardtii]PNW80563.1 hypothetical protein CHLRE_07g322884v5 [Chlamydomonas reinhardtii]
MHGLTRAAILESEAPIGSQPLPAFRVLLLALPYAAHSLPLLRLGQELASRGNAVFFGSTDDYVELPYGKQVDFAALGVTWLPLGAPLHNASQRHEREQWAVEHWDSNNPDNAFRNSTGVLMREFHVVFLNGLAKTHKLGPGSFDVVITDFLTSAGHDYAEYIGAPLVVFNSLSYIAFESRMMAVPPALLMPVMPIMLPYKMDFAAAVQNTLMTLLFEAKPCRTFLDIMDECRALGGLVPGSFRQSLTRRPQPLLLIPAAPGFEPPVALPPHVRVVGGMLFESGPMSDKIREYLESDPGTPVIYVGFGSFVDFPDPTYALILRALGRVPARVLWSLKPKSAPSVMAAIANGTAPANVRVEPWVQQLAVLRHPAVKAVVTHGGFSSVSEIMYVGKPMVAIPGFGDNEHNAWKLQQLGAAVQLSKESPQLEQQLVEAVNKVLTDPSYTAAARRLGLVTRTAPGAPHAAALVEQVAALGSTQHLSSPDNTGVVAAATATLAAVPLVLAALVLVCLARCLGGSGRRRVMKAKPE